jgi:aminoglycoside 3-N-acetyltransferase
MRLDGHHIRAIGRRCLPAPVLRLKRSIARWLETRARESEKRRAIEKYGLFGPELLYETLRAAGIRKGCVLLVHSSWDRFHNFTGTARDVLDVLENLVGDEGTLLMPAHTHYGEEGPFVFDARRSPAHTGILCEMFRRERGVVRSLHPTHSVCARGPLAEALTRDHHKGPLSCGPLSPYAKLMDYGGEILGLGLPPAFTTFLHVVEDMDLDDYPRRTYLDGEREFSVIDGSGGKMSLNIKRRDPVLGSGMDLNRIVPHLAEGTIEIFSIAGVPAFRAGAVPFFKEVRRLKKQGIIIYA